MGSSYAMEQRDWQELLSKLPITAASLAAQAAQREVLPVISSSAPQASSARAAAIIADQQKQSERIQKTLTTTPSTIIAEQVIAESVGKDVVLKNIHTGVIIRTLAMVWRFAYSSDRQIIAVDASNGCTLINAHDGSIMRTITTSYNSKLSPNGQIIAVEKARELDLMNVRDGSIIGTIAGAFGPEFSLNGSRVVMRSTGREGTSVTLLVNTADGSMVKSFPNSCRFSCRPDGQSFVVETDSSIATIDARDGSIMSASPKV